ncbi:hypothetical protein HPB52_004386 [Rhipicephalus sanguineus]|uniref:Uncharacterized protein n=1 Tax=Rhipicephalus sanguineus TaxID=34632 RepID=A0A9D4T590_RHISA|nr:hypothetical protein HPB52_004386 [Rhipicephalus sanguineus]
MERGRKKRMVIRAQATRLINECEQGRQISLTPNEAGVLHAPLISIRTELDAVNNEIEALVSEDDLEEEYMQTQPAQQIDGDVTETTMSQKMKVKLPRLELVKFSGRQQERQPFWELYEQVVDNIDQLSTLDKFHYLRASLTGVAASVLTDLPPTSRSYNDAKQLLKKCFGNEELPIQEHTKLINITPVCVSDDVRGLRRLYDTVSAHIRGLETLGRKLDSFSSMLLPIVHRA